MSALWVVLTQNNCQLRKQLVILRISCTIQQQLTVLQVFEEVLGKIRALSDLINFHISLPNYVVFVKVIAWFVVIFDINTTSDISKLLYVISRAVRQVKFETILKYYQWYLCQISRTNHAIICLYYYPQMVCNFHL